MEKLLVIFVLLAFCTFLVLVSASYNVTSIFTFGDSILDAGNNHFNKNCSVQADFPPYGTSFFHNPTGRFTNGRTVVDFVSQYLGIEFQKPYLEANFEVMNGSIKNYPSNGINFASAGSGVLSETNKYWGITPLRDQLKQFQILVEQNKIDKNILKNSIFFFESGSNDIFNYFLFYDKIDPGTFIRNMLTEAANLIDEIYKLGARRIAVFSLGPVGCVPARALLRAPVNKCFGKMNVMVKKYNKGLEQMVTNIHIKYPGGVGVYGAVYDIVQRFRANPTHYGFSDVTNGCCGGGTLRGQLQCGKKGYKMCQDPNQFLFWDYFHPSEHTYKLISEALWGGPNSTIRPINLKTMASMV